MDPLSITASILGVIGAAQKAIQGLSYLKAANRAPERLMRLLDQVTRFEIVLRAIKNAVPDLENRNS